MDLENNNVMLFNDDVEKFYKKAQSPTNIFWSIKIDGVRCWAVYRKNEITYLSRNKKVFKNFNIFDGELFIINKLLMERFSLQFPIILDGEVAASDGKFKNVMTQAHRLKDSNTEILRFHVFDIITNKTNTFSFERRTTMLRDVFRMYQTKYIKLEEQHQYTGNSINGLYNIRDMMISKGHEGIMLRTKDSPYEFKRSSFGCKMKNEGSIELNVIGIEFGKGKYSAKVGALICEYKGNKVNVGSGLSDEQRELFITQPPKIILVEYTEKTEKGSLRHPRFIKVIK